MRWKHVYLLTYGVSLGGFEVASVNNPEMSGKNLDSLFLSSFTRSDSTEDHFEQLPPVLFFSWLVRSVLLMNNHK